MLRKLLLGLLALLVLIVLALSLVIANQRSPVIDGSDADAPPLAWWSQKLIQGVFDYRARTGARSGYIAMFARDGEIVYATTSGYADVENQVPMTLDTRVRIASNTKPITAVAAMILVEEGRLDLDDTVATYIPAAANLRVATSHQRNAAGDFDTRPLESPLLVRHLLMFASGIGGSSSIGDDSDLERLWQERGVSGSTGNLAQRVDAAMQLPLFEEPGTKWRYGGSADVMARVVEVAAGQPFSDFLQQRIFQPLGMTHTEHLPPPDQQGDLARVYTQNKEGKLELVEERLREESDWTPGGGGLVSTAGDYMRFGLMMRNGGSLDGVQILKPETVAEMTRPHLKSGVLADRGMKGMGWGLGMAVVVDSDATTIPDRDGDYWWAGYHGTYWSVSPETDMVSVVFSQYEPGPYTDNPLAVHLASSVAQMGL